MPARNLTAKELDRLASLREEIRNPAKATYHRVQSELCAASDFICVLGACLRTPERQGRYFKVGRRRVDGKWRRIPGVRIISNAKPWQGPHVVGLAFHLVLQESLTGAWLPDDHPAWVSMGEIGEQDGWTWGGRWTSPRDCAHFELTDWRRESEHERLAIKEQYGSEYE